MIRGGQKRQILRLIGSRSIYRRKVRTSTQPASGGDADTFCGLAGQAIGRAPHLNLCIYRK